MLRIYDGLGPDLGLDRPQDGPPCPNCLSLLGTKVYSNSGNTKSLSISLELHAAIFFFARINAILTRYNTNHSDLES